MNLANVDPRFPQYKNKGLLVDTNLLLLYLVGELELELVPKFKRTNSFHISDYFRLKTIIDFFPTIVTTPGVLTEVSNFAGQLDGRRKTRFFARFTEKIRTLREEYVPSTDAAAIPAFGWLRLTDASIILACKDKYLAITTDFPLSRFMEDNLLDVINFNYLRSQDWN